MNPLKFIFQRDLARNARRAAEQRIFATGRSWPCTVTAVDGAIVTVQLDMQAPFALPTLTIPKAESPWVRMPTQVGDRGVTMAVDAYLGAISGLGISIAQLCPTFNLSELVFVPVSNAGSPPPNVNAATVQGPDGAIIQTTTGTMSNITVNQSDITLTYGSSQITINGTSITMTAGGNTVTLNSAGFDIGGIEFGTHIHGGVTTGSGTTTGPEA